jgi:2-iminobutanoate/2-iminopropanoate deaminase
MKKGYFPIIILMILSIVSCETESSETIFHNSHHEKRQKTPFSDAVETDDLLFLAGQIGRDHDQGILVEGGIQAETKQAIENIKDVLEFHDLQLDNVVKCTVILSDISDFAAFNEVYKQYFIKKPARTTFAASGLAANAKIEIDVIVAK